MSIITLLSASYCHGEEVAGKVADRLGYRLLTDADLIRRASDRFGTPLKKLERTLYGLGSSLNRIILSNQRNTVTIAHIRSTLAEAIQDDSLIYHGIAGCLLPKSLSHVLWVCLIAKLEYRIATLTGKEEIAAKKAKQILITGDEAIKEWTLQTLGLSPWDKNLYDVFLPMDKMTIEGAVQIISESAADHALQRLPRAQSAMKDFLIACRVYETLAEKSGDVEVACDKGAISLTINKFVVRLEHFKKKLEKIVTGIPGVTMVKVDIGPGFHQSSYPMVDPPRKILLVDDEVDFVQTLSQRLETRSLGAAMVFNGEEALAAVETDPPEVMVLDLKMPGIDGLEVLRRVKKTNPKIEVIVLTGHGTEIEEAVANDLGAFAYLQKPADIDDLAKTMRAAYRKIEQAKKGK